MLIYKKMLKLIPALTFASTFFFGSAAYAGPLIFNMTVTKDQNICTYRGDTKTGGDDATVVFGMSNPITVRISEDSKEVERDITVSCNGVGYTLLMSMVNKPLSGVILVRHNRGWDRAAVIPGNVAFKVFEKK